MWPWLARMEIEVGHTRLSCHEEVPLLNLNLISSCCNSIHWLCSVYFTAISSWKVVAALSTIGIIGDEEENFAEDSEVEKLWVLIIDQWSDASERLVS